jgi:hypothetical protein
MSPLFKKPFIQLSSISNKRICKLLSKQRGFLSNLQIWSVEHKFHQSLEFQARWLALMQLCSQTTFPTYVKNSWVISSILQPVLQLVDKIPDKELVDIIDFKSFDLSVLSYSTEHIT